MAGYEAVKRGFVHVGVRRKSDGIVYHLQDEDGRIRIDCEEDNGEWRVYPEYQQVGSDDDVVERADELYNSIKELNRQGTVIPYHASGDGVRGLNCENLVGIVLEGNTAPKAGQIISYFEELGIDVEPFIRGDKNFGGSISS